MPKKVPSQTEKSADPSSLRGGTASNWVRLAGMGMELAGITLAGMAIGYAIDRVIGSAVGWGVAGGLLVGFTLAMVRFIIKATRASR